MGEQVEFLFRKYIARNGEVAFGDGAGFFSVYANELEVRLVFVGGGGSGAKGVAEVEVDHAGHDRIEVDDTAAVARCVEHNVVELGVVVGDAGP